LIDLKQLILTLSYDTLTRCDDRIDVLFKLLDPEGDGFVYRERIIELVEQVTSVSPKMNNIFIDKNVEEGSRTYSSPGSYPIPFDESFDPDLETVISQRRCQRPKTLSRISMKSMSSDEQIREVMKSTNQEITDEVNEEIKVKRNIESLMELLLDYGFSEPSLIFSSPDSQTDVLENSNN